MTDPGQISALSQAFLGRFVAPLFFGGEVLVDRPLPPSILATLAHARPVDESVSAQLFDAIHATASLEAPTATLPFPELGFMSMALAAHNLAALTDPALDRAFARRARPVVLSWVDALLDRVPLPETRGATLARHALASRVLSVRRTDTVVTNWAYTYRYSGRPVPPRVLALPRVRRVKRRDTTSSFTTLLRHLETEEAIDAPARLRAFVSRSPFTELARPDLAPDLTYGWGTLAVLSDARLRGAITRHLSKVGLERVEAVHGPALRRISADELPEAAVGALTAFAWELHVRLSVAHPDDRDLEESRAGGAGPFAALVVAMSAASLPPVFELAPKERERAAARVRLLRSRVTPDDGAWARTMVRPPIPLENRA